jgi:hypothetical protein
VDTPPVSNQPSVYKNRRGRMKKKMMKNKILTAGFFTAIMLIASFTALAGSNGSHTSTPATPKEQKTIEHDELGNTVTVYGHVWTWVRGPYGYLRLKPVQGATVKLWFYTGEGLYKTNTTDVHGYYEFSSIKRADYMVNARVYDEYGETIAMSGGKEIRANALFLLFKNKFYAPLILSYAEDP